MEKKDIYQEILQKLSIYRIKKNMSARELSMILDHNDSFINRVENNKTELNMKVFLEILNIFGISPIEFFYVNQEQYEQDKRIIERLSRLSADDKNLIENLIKRLSKD